MKYFKGSGVDRENFDFLPYIFYNNANKIKQSNINKIVRVNFLLKNNCEYDLSKGFHEIHVL